MSALTVSPSQADIQTALRAFLLAVLPDGTEVFEGLDNRVPESSAPNFVTMTVLRRPRLGTNVDALVSGGLSASVTQPTMVVIQLDIHASDVAIAADNAQVISTMFRDDFAVKFFEAYPNIAPLYADDPRLLPFINAENQYEPRYIVEAVLQANQIVTTTAQSATALTVNITDVDTPAAAALRIQRRATRRLKRQGCRAEPTRRSIVPGSPVDSRRCESPAGSRY